MSTAPPLDPVELLRELIRFDTTNPGNEGPCIDHLSHVDRIFCVAELRVDGEGVALPEVAAER